MMKQSMHHSANDDNSYTKKLNSFIIILLLFQIYIFWGEGHAFTLEFFYEIYG